MNYCELLVSVSGVAHSSRGLGHLPLKEEITGSNPVCATKLDFYIVHSIIFKSIMFANKSGMVMPEWRNGSATDL